ncbi:hypothetical protein CDAR_486211 [Caerostris darwini]|uniref:Uncharacterized protein n=1 Tax=Caerostris darwini TaxID=1538125 RepID=A0AAV4MCL6_9ARAC|nr:hypothetical protein CDAR_486211 [Caerostris darwini]
MKKREMMDTCREKCGQSFRKFNFFDRIHIDKFLKSTFTTRSTISYISKHNADYLYTPTPVQQKSRAFVVSAGQLRASAMLRGALIFVLATPSLHPCCTPPHKRCPSRLLNSLFSLHFASSGAANCPLIVCFGISSREGNRSEGGEKKGGRDKIVPKVQKICF